jgi:hypothetical protein
MFELENNIRGNLMTGYQKAKVTAMWIKAGKPDTLEEWATTVDIKAIVDPNPTKNQPKPPSHIEIVQRVFGDAKVVA